MSATSPEPHPSPAARSVGNAPQPFPGPMERDKIAKAEADNRKKTKSEGVPTDARRREFQDFAPTHGGEIVHVNADTVQEIANLMIDRRSAAEALAAKGGDDHDPLESMIAATADKWESWLQYFQGGDVPDEKQRLTKEDLDVAYYVLFDTMLQLGVAQGRNVRYEQGWFGPRAVVEPDSPSYLRRSGWTSEYSRIRASRLEHPRQMDDVLLDLEKTRRNFVQSLTGRRINDGVFNRLNWGGCMESLLMRERSGLRLHDQILAQFEGSAGYRGLLQEYSRRTGRQLHSINDLLVTIDNPQDRNTFLKLYHEALGKASQERFGTKGKAFADAYLGKRQEQWESAQTIENVEQAIVILQGEAMSTEQKGEVEKLQAQFQEIRGFLAGMEGGQGLPQKFQDLQNKINAYRLYQLRPENDLTTAGTGLRDRLATAELQLAERIRGVRNPLNDPPDVQSIETELTTISTTIQNLERNPPPVPYNGLTPERRAEMVQENRTLRSDITRRLREAREAYINHSRTERDGFNTRITTITTELERRGNEVDTAYNLISVDIPTQLTHIQILRDQLHHIIANPNDYPHLRAHTARLGAQVTYLDSLYSYLNNTIVIPLRKDPGEFTDVYINRAVIHGYAFDQSAFQTQTTNLETHMNGYQQIFEHHVDPATEDRIHGMKLGLAVVKGGAYGEPSTPDAHTSPRLLDKAIQRCFTEQGGQLIARLRNERDLDALRELLLDYAELRADAHLRDPLLWRRVFNDEFLLQKAIEFCNELEIPAGSIKKLGAPGNNFTNQVIEHLGEFQQLRMAEFLVYLGEKKLEDIASTTQTSYHIREARDAGAGVIRYDDVPTATGYGAKVFSSEFHTDFTARMRRKRALSMRFASRAWNIDNVGNARQIRQRRPFMSEVEGRRLGRTIEINTSGDDPLVMDIGGRRREFYLRLGISRGRLDNHLEVHLRANPSLLGIRIPDVGGRNFDNLDNRWMNLVPLGDRATGLIFADFNGFLTRLRERMGIIAGQGDVQTADVDRFNSQITNFTLRSLGNYFLGLSPGEARLQYPRFPSVALDSASQPNLVVAGYKRISMDPSGNLELTRDSGEIVSVESVLETAEQNAQLDEIFRLVGQQIFDIMGN